MAEALRLGKTLPIGTDTTPREIKGDGREAGMCQAVCQFRKKTPVLEAFEPVTYHDRRSVLPGGGCSHVTP